MQHIPKAVDAYRRESKKKFGTTISSSCLKFPTASGGAPIPTATARNIYKNAHLYHINSLSLYSDGKTFLSADDLRIHWWDLEVSDETFSKYLPSFLIRNS